MAGLALLCSFLWWGLLNRVSPVTQVRNSGSSHLSPAPHTECWDGRRVVPHPVWHYTLLSFVIFLSFYCLVEMVTNKSSSTSLLIPTAPCGSAMPWGQQWLLSDFHFDSRWPTFPSIPHLMWFSLPGASASSRAGLKVTFFFFFIWRGYGKDIHSLDGFVHSFKPFLYSSLAFSILSLILDVFSSNSF